MTVIVKPLPLNELCSDAAPTVSCRKEDLMLFEWQRAVALGDKFVWCIEHERPSEECQNLAMVDYGQPYFDNCYWVTEEECKESE